jgi:hypothetical protein
MSAAAFLIDVPFRNAESFLLQLALFLIFVFGLTKIVVAAYRELRRDLGKANTNKSQTRPRE